MEFGKVYIMLGMNELGWVYESVFKEDYGKIIDKIREIKPGRHDIHPVHHARQ